jgi:hypothetical protein
MLTENEKKMGIIEIGEKAPRRCTHDNAELWAYVSWALHRGNDYFTYRMCLKCGTVYKVLEPVPEDLWFMGPVPTNEAT